MKNHITRRTLLRLGLGGLGWLGATSPLARLGRLQAQAVPEDPDYKALVCIFLFGGNDGNNTVIPIQTGIQTHATYAAARGSGITLARASLPEIRASNGDIYGLHPSLAPLQALHQQGRMSVVANVGTLIRPLTKAQYDRGQVPVPTNLFSHSDQQQQWQTSPGLRTGWGGRAADILQALNGTASFPTGLSTSGNPVFLNGQNTKPASVTNGGLGLDGSDGSANANVRDAALQQLLTFDSGMSLIQAANRHMTDGIAAGKELNAALNSGGALQTVFPNTGLGSQLEQVAKVLKVRGALGMSRQIFFTSMGGFDTHSNQLPSHAALLAELGNAMAAFDNAIRELGLDGKVVTFTESEFGRTCQPSTGVGSDHAWGSHQIVMGSALRSADVYGTFPLLDLDGPDDVTGRGVWLPTASLDQYAATLASWFGVPDGSLATVFPNLPNFAQPKLAFL